MTTHTVLPAPKDPRWKPNAQRGILLRLIISLVTLSILFLGQFYGTLPSNVIIVSILVVFLTHLIGLIFINRELIRPGMGIINGGIIFGLFFVSVVTEGFGLFAMLFMILLTSMIVATTVSRVQAARSIVASVSVGLLALLFDLFIGPAPFRIPTPPLFQSLLWAGITIMALTSIYSIARQFNSFALRTKLITSFVLVTVMTLALVSFLNDRTSRIALTNDANEALFAAASQTRDSIEDFITANIFAVQTEAQLPDFIDYLSLPSSQRNSSEEKIQARDTLLALSTKDELHISSYALIDTNGITLLDTDTNDIGTNKSDREYVQHGLQTDEPFISSVEFSPRTGRPSIYFSHAVKNTRGVTVGVLRIRYNASILQNLVRRSNDLVGADSFGVLFDENFIHLAHGIDPNALFTVVFSTSDQALIADQISQLKESRLLPDIANEELAYIEPDLSVHLISALQNPDFPEYFTSKDIATENRTNQVVAISLDTVPWVLTFFQPQDVFLAPVTAQTQTTILLSVVIAIGVVALALIISQMLTNPIIGLTSVAQKVAEGNLEIQAPILTQDEIGLLAQTFNSMTSQINTLVTGLEDQVAARTRDLERQATLLQAAAEIARDATAETELDDLLNKAVNLTRQRFSVYFVGIYLLDKPQEYAVLTAATDIQGDQLLENNFKIQVGDSSPVGYTTITGEPTMATIDPNTPDILRNSILPDTRAEIAIPLRVGDDILGALDIHIADENQFNQADIALFRTMADQLSIALQKTTLRTEVEQTLSELETAYRRYTRSSWDALVKPGERSLGYRYHSLGTDSVHTQDPLTRMAWEKNQSVVSSEGPDKGSSLAIPMKIRDETIGVLNLQFEDEVALVDSQSLIEEVASRLGLVLENARLLESTQKRAESERLLSDITGHIRETLDIDAILRTTVQEIGEKMGVSEVEIRFDSSSELDSTNGSPATRNADPYIDPSGSDERIGE
ncbi:MAG: GAF domain-containing protein [Anaerolineae bacterium]|nr:GAF domain-containing protein [Anaerolineae bacterium]